MQYTSSSGQTVHGDVWSPGPIAATVWVLTPGGGTAVVHVSSRREVPYDRYMRGATSGTSKGPTLSAGLWRQALGFDPRAVVRGEAEQPELVACLEQPAVAEVLEEPTVTAVPEPVAPELEQQPEPEPVAVPIGTAVRIPVDSAGRDGRVIGAVVEDGRVKVRCVDTVGSVWLIEPDRLTLLEQPTEAVAEAPTEAVAEAPAELAAEPVAVAPRIDYRKRVAHRKPVAASRKLVADRKPVAEAVEQPVRIDYRKPTAPAPRIDYRKPVAQACPDARCTDGLTRCDGCNGYGVVTAGGRRYRLSGGGRNISATAVRHEPCAGTGLAVCGCGRLGADRKPVAAT